MTLQEVKSKMKIFNDLHYIHFSNEGHIVWRYGSGDNVEILDIEAYKKRQGIGTKLIRQLARDLKRHHPSPHNIFGFTKSENDEALGFYESLGFKISLEIYHLYRYGAKLFIISYRDIAKI